MNNQIIKGSVSAIAAQNNMGLAESFLSVDVIILCDVSGSMGAHDSRNNQTRYEVMCQELTSLQKGLPGKLGVVAFDNNPQFCPGGLPVFSGGGTDLYKALQFVKVADLEGMRFILISDGEPDDKTMALKVAKTFTNKIDVVYVGPENLPAGRAFLQQLAAACGGKSVTADRAKELGATIQTLLLKG